jgi:hypothetical protein
LASLNITIWKDYHMKIQKNKFVFVLLIASLLAVACGGTSGNTATDAAGTEQASGGLSQATRLALGILKLEDTGQAVTVEQAEELLTLWQGYQALGNSETTASEELDAVVNQIEGTLTSEQLEAINSLGLTNESVLEVMQQQGIEFGPGGVIPEGTPQAGSGFGGFQNGEMPSGGFPGSGTMPEGGSPGSGMRGSGDEMQGGGLGGAMGLQGTPGVMDQNRFNALGSQVNPMLLRVLISLLEAKIEATQ